MPEFLVSLQGFARKGSIQPFSVQGKTVLIQDQGVRTPMTQLLETVGICSGNKIIGKSGIPMSETEGILFIRP